MRYKIWFSKYISDRLSDVLSSRLIIANSKEEAIKKIKNNNKC